MSEELSPALGECHAERLDVLKAYLYGHAGNIGGNEHAAAHGFARQDAALRN